MVRPAYRKRLTNLKQTSSAYLLFATLAGGAELLNGRNLFVQQRAGLFSAGHGEDLSQRSMYLTLSEAAADNSKSSLVAIVPADFAEVSTFFFCWAADGLEAYAGYKQQVTDKLLTYIDKKLSRN